MSIETSVIAAPHPSAKSKVVAIRFQPLGKLYHFDNARVKDLRIGDYVLVSTRRGREMGEVAGFVDRSKGRGKLKPIERMATAQELVLRRMWQRKELEAMIECRVESADVGLEGVKIAKAEYSFDGSRLTFLYNYEGEVKSIVFGADCRGFQWNPRSHRDRRYQRGRSSSNGVEDSRGIRDANGIGGAIGAVVSGDRKGNLGLFPCESLP